MSAQNDLLNELRIDRKAPVTAPASNNTLRWIIISVIILGLLLAGYFLFAREKPVMVQTAIASSLANTGSGNASVLDASGYITARRIATVSSKITGKIREVMIEEGQRVEAGQILATLDRTDADAQHTLTQSQLASAQSQLAEAQAQLKLAERNLARQRELAGKKLIAASSLDASIAERDSSAARLESLQRAVKVARDRLAISDIDLDNTVIRAPFAGVIVTKSAQPGEMISPISAGGGSIRTGVGTLVDMDSLEVQVDVNESYIGRVQPKMPVEAVLNAYPEWKIPAEVIAIVPTADRSKATVKVRIALKSKDPRIVPDMGVRVSFLEGDKPAVVNAVVPKGVLIPETALIGDDAVFVINEGTAKRQSVQAGDKRGDQRVILSGLNVGDSVIVSPAPDLVDGARVQSQ